MTSTQVFLAVVSVLAFTSAFTTPQKSHPFPCNSGKRIFRSRLIPTGRAGEIIASRIEDDQDKGPCLIFPGGGLFFYWQAGVIAYLQERGYDLSTTSSPCHLCGASAGALAATLAATEVNPYEATELALSLSEKAGVWDRPLGLQGVWGNMIYEWLDILLPDDAVERVVKKLHLVVTPVPSFGKSRICDFHSREDLIMANMASVHIPWFLDGNLTTNFRGKPHIDGSFLAKLDDYVSETHSDQPKLILDFKRDPIMRERSTEFVKLVSPQGIRDILEQGKKYAEIMDSEGEFSFLPQR